MPLIVPSPEELTVPGIDVTAELMLQRRLTHAFIVADPVQVALVPRVDVRRDSGGYDTVDGTPRPLQTMRLIPMSHTEKPARSSSSAASSDAGQQRRYDFTLLGEWDAIMENNDWWQDERGQRWFVETKVPYNGYEVKGLVLSVGRHP